MHEDKTKETDYIAFVDGGSRGNPGPSASAFTISRGGEFLVTKGLFLGTKTNNEAEYRALAELVSHFVGAGYAQNITVNVFSDSLLMVNQLTGVWATKDENLQRIQRGIFEQMSAQEYITFKLAYVPREFNKEADKAVNMVLDDAIYKGPLYMDVGEYRLWSRAPVSASWSSEILDKLVHAGAFNRLRRVHQRRTFFKGGIA